jgi:hypothetical protein
MKNILILLVGLFLMSCNDCNIKSGNYGDGILLIKVDESNVEGILNFTQGDPKVKCYLEFKFIQDEECNKAVKLVDSFGNEFKGRIEIRENELFIQSLEPLGACQRIIDLSTGEAFSLDE